MPQHLLLGRAGSSWGTKDSGEATSMETGGTNMDAISLTMGVKLVSALNPCWAPLASTRDLRFRLHHRFVEDSA
ncbi:hypothetical protein V5799_000794 [Amblyomma americanum]|uniref:Uncharacterized protein n=1 Tax=Amblyomma americanum TaxID=6943 RepID=A0AAQ4D211_AMBAM